MFKVKWDLLSLISQFYDLKAVIDVFSLLIALIRPKTLFQEKKWKKKNRGINFTITMVTDKNLHNQTNVQPVFLWVERLYYS